MRFTDNQISELRLNLKKYYGSIKEVAERVEKTPDWISRMLRSKAKWDVDIINVALDVCKEYRDKKDQKTKEALEKMKEMNIG